MVTIVVGFRKDIAFIPFSLLLSKTGTKLDKGRVTGALLNDISKVLECILLDLFNVKLHAHSLDSHIQRICNASLERKKAHFRPYQIYMIACCENRQ